MTGAPESHARPRGVLAMGLAYVGTLALAAGLLLILRVHGEALVAPVTSLPTRAVAGHGAVLAQVLVSLAVITLSARAAGAFFRRVLRQPPVIGEILAGLALGPSLLGAISPAATAFVLPTAVAPHLGIVAKLGVVLFMFLVGLELDAKALRASSHATLVISHASIVVPFVLGAALALVLYPIHGSRHVSFTVFALFLGISMSVTAFPVLARILTDLDLAKSNLGRTAIACAAVDDATAWCLLAFVSGVANADLGHAGRTIALVAGYLAFMLFAVRPLAARFVAHVEDREGPSTQGDLAVACTALFLSAAATEAIGIHALFGAFLVGASFPPESKLARHLRERLEDLVLVALLPAFFAFTGLRTEVSLVGSARDAFLTAAIVAVATLGKFGGTYVAARFARHDARDSAALGILMNTRGLMELIVLNVGLDMGVLSPTLFTMFVLMALVTTFATSPVLRLVRLGAA